jgi:hypothetical protein
MRAFINSGMRRFAIALMLFVSTLPLQCATLERLSLDDIIARSTSIVRGTVSTSWAAFSGPVIYTHYTVQVAETLKGLAGKSVEVVVPGGVVNNLRQSFSGAPALANGGSYVLFLYTGKSGLTQVIGLTQGLFALSADSPSDPTATRLASRELMLDPATAKPVKDQTLVMKLSQLRSRVSGARAAQ